MEQIGILAYGSLISDPGKEIKPRIKNRIQNIRTPFKIEFARSSSSRGNAPTVIPVEKYGSAVKATILVLNEDITVEQAEDLLWRRETRNENSKRHYEKPINPNNNQVIVEKISNLGGVKHVLYTKIGANIEDPTPEKLASLAVIDYNSSSGNGVNSLTLSTS